MSIDDAVVSGFAADGVWVSGVAMVENGLRLCGAGMRACPLRSPFGGEAAGCTWISADDDGSDVVVAPVKCAKLER